MATLTILLACILYIFLFSELWLNYYLCCTKKSPLKIKKRGAFGTPYAPSLPTEPKFSIALLQWSVLLDKLESPKGVIITSDRVLAKPLGADNDDAETAIAEAALEHVSTYNPRTAVMMYLLSVKPSGSRLIVYQPSLILFVAFDIMLSSCPTGRCDF